MAKNEPPSNEQLEALRADHGEIVQADSDGVYVVLAKPSKANIGAVYARFIEKAGVPASKAAAMTGLFKSCVIYPGDGDSKDVAALLADEPGLALTFAPACTELIGIREANVKKS